MQRYIHLLLIGICCLACHTSLHAQFTFQKILGETNEQIGTSVIELDTAYIIGGYTFNSSNNSYDITLTSVLKSNVSLNNKVTAFPSIDTTGAIPSPNGMQDHLYDMEITGSGEVIMTGDVSSVLGMNNLDMAVNKFELSYSTLNIEWTKRYGRVDDGSGNASHETGKSIIYTDDGNYVVTGIRRIHNKDTTGFILKMDDEGDLIDSVHFDIPASAGLSVTEDANHNFIVTGYGKPGSNGKDLIVLKFDNDLNYITGKYYSKSGVDFGSAVISRDQLYYVVGATTTLAGDKDIIVYQLQNDLTVEWRGVYGTPNKNFATDVVLTCDSDLAICGVISDSSNNTGAKGNSDGFLMKIDTGSGNIIWSRIYGYEGGDGFEALKSTKDGGFIMTGYSEDATTNGFGNKDIFINKTDAGGKLSEGCPGTDTIAFSSSITSTPMITLSYSPVSTNFPQNPILYYPDTSISFTENVRCVDSIKLLTVDAGPDDTICKGSSIVINEGDTTIKEGQPPYSINWTPSAPLDDPSLEHPTATPDTTTDFIIEVEDQNCVTVKDTVTIYVVSADSGWSGLDTSYCSADMKDKLTPNEPGGTFIGPGVHYNGSFWYFDPSEPTPGYTYQIGYIDKYGCDTNWKQTYIESAPCVSDVVTDSTAGTIVNPQGINTDCEGQIYVTNESHINKIDTFGNSKVFIGDTSNTGYKDGHVDSALVDHPFGISIASDGTVYFCDNYNHSVRMYKNDTVTTIVGDPPPGKNKGTRADTAGKDALISSPFGLTLGPNEDYLYVTEADGTNPNRLLRVDLTSGDYYVKKLAGGGSYDVTQPRDGDSAHLYKMGHMMIKQNNVFIAGYGKSIIYKYDTVTDSVSVFAGAFNDANVVTGHKTNEARFIKPIGLSINCSGELFLTDKSIDVIRMIDNDTVYPYFDGSDGLNEPTDISVFVKGYLDVANTGANNILRLTIKDWQVGPWVGLDTSDYTYCLGAGPDTLNPIYPCGTYSGPNVSYDTSINKYIFDPPDTTGVYTLTYNYAVSYCSESMSQDFRVVENPTLNMDPAAICSGDSATLNAKSRFIDYSWNTGATTQKITVGDTGDYTVEVLDSNHCPTADTTHVSARPYPTADAGPDSTICEGDTLQIGGSPTGSGGTPPLDYLWQPAMSLTDDTVANPYAYPDTTTEYKVTVIDSFNCTNMDSVTINVDSQPLADAGMDDTICNGQSDTLDASGSSGTGPLSYSWSDGLGTGVSHIVSPSATEEYMVTVTASTGCNARDAVSVIVNPAVNAYAGTDDTICTGDTLRLGGSPTATGGTGTYTYSWSPSASLDDATVAHPQAFPGSSTTYTVTVMDTEGCADTSSISVVVNDMNADAGNMDTICQGDTLTLNGSASGGSSPYTYSWSPADIMDNPSGANPDVYPSTDTTFIMDVTDGAGCSATDSVDILVNPNPVATVNPDTTICENESVSLQASGGVNYSWSPATGLSDPNIADPLATPPDTTTYTVTVSDAAGCQDDTSVTIYVNQVDIMLSPYPDTSICKGDSIQLQASGGVNYSWSPSSGLSDTTVSGPFAKPSDSTTYQVAVEDNKGCSDTGAVDIHVIDIQVEAGNTDTVCNGDTILLSGTASGGVSPYNYSWNPADFLVDPSNANTGAYPVSDTTFYLEVSDNSGCSSKDSVHIHVQPLPVAEVMADTSMCSSDSLQLSATGGSAYTWSPSAGLNDPNIRNPMASPSDDTTYTVTVTDSVGCRDDTSVNIAVNTVNISYKDTMMICEGDSRQITPQGGNTYTYYSWTPATGLNDTTIQSPIAGPSFTTTYKVTATDTIGCEGYDSIRVRVSRNLTAHAGSGDSICKGNDIRIGDSPAATGGISPYNYYWSPEATLDDSTSANPTASPDTLTEYVLQVTDLAGCKANDSLLLGIFPLPAAEAGPADTICYKDTTRIGGDSTASGTVAPYTYAWSPSGGLLSTDSGNPLAAPVNTTDHLTNKYYTVTVTDAHGCQDKDSMRLSMLPEPNINVSYDSICRGDSIQLIARGGIQYSWDPVEGLSDPFIFNPMASPDSLTHYVVTINSPYCGPETDTATVKVNPLPHPAAGPDTSIYWGEKVQLYAEDGVQYQWSPQTEILTADTIPDPVVKPTDSTAYRVSVTNIYNCSSQDTAYIGIKKDVNIYVPSAFAPNGNVPENQKLCVKGVGLKSIDFRIYNRWGQTVFHTTDPDKCWDGTLDETSQQMQTYGYVLEATDYTGTKHRKTGTITLIK